MGTDGLTSGEGWRVEFPSGLIAKSHTAWGYDSGVIARGWIGEAPVTAVVQVTQLEAGFNAWVRQFASTWLAHESRRVRVPGATDAFRIDGHIEFDGLGAADGREHCIAICARRRGHAVALTIRSRPEDAVQADLEPIVASFELLP
jgi:hypothetical protein